jgi:hypothetical protein
MLRMGTQKLRHLGGTPSPGGLLAKILEAYRIGLSRVQRSLHCTERLNEDSRPAHFSCHANYRKRLIDISFISDGNINTTFILSINKELPLRGVFSNTL